MSYETFGTVEYYRPAATSNEKMRREAEEHVRKKFAVGVYSEVDKINSFFQILFKFFEDKINTLVPRFASREFLEFILYQYDGTGRIYQLLDDGQLSSSESEKWDEIAPLHRRALKYLAEKVVYLQPGQRPRLPLQGNEYLLDELLIAADEVIRCYELSEQTYAVFPEDTVLEVFPKGQPLYYEQKVLSDCRIIDAKAIDYSYGKEYTKLSNHQLSLLHDSGAHNEVIGAALEKTVGATYVEIIDILQSIINQTAPAPDRLPVLFLHLDGLTEKLAEIKALDKQVVSQIIGGFTITPTTMRKEDRAVWKPKQEYRALRRGFFDMPHPSGSHIAFSRQMAKDSLTALQTSVTFKTFPPEWRSEEVDDSLSTLSNDAGKWFERVVQEKISSLGFNSVLNVTGLACGGNKIIIPEAVGEIDLLAYSSREKILLVAECKLVKPTSESRTYRDDLSKFLKGEKAYIKSFMRKVRWLGSSHKRVISALHKMQIVSDPNEVTVIAPVMLTYSSTVADCFIKDFPCVSITNFMLDYREHGTYPYIRGVINLSG